ncbi:MAG: hypothetical protein AB7Q29_15450 [Vicinamibacterales bacterium]
MGAVALLYVAPLLSGLGALLPANLADPRFNAWVLAWGAQRLPHGLQGFWTPPFYYPYQDTLAYSENLLGITLFVAPVQWIGGNPTLTYNVAFLLSFIVAGVGAYLLARELTGSRAAAAVAACGFAFGPYRWAQMTHLQVMTVGWMPLGLWALHRALRAPSARTLGIFAASVLLQALSNGYAVFQMVLAVGLVGAWAAVTRSADRRVLLRAAAAAVVAAIVLMPIVMTHQRVWSTRAPASTEMLQQSADLGTYLAVVPDLPLARVLPGVQQDEGNLFPGFAVLVLAIAAVTPIGRRSKAGHWRYLYLGLATIALVVSLGPAPTAWHHALPVPGVYAWLVSTVPLFHVLRVPARFGLLVQLAVVVLAAIGMAGLTARLSRRQAWAAALPILAVVLFEGYGGPLQVRTAAYEETEQDRAVYAWLAAQPPGPLLELPLSSLGRDGYGLRHQYAALSHGHTGISGASRLNSPLATMIASSASPLFDPALADEAVPFLQGLGVRYVIVRPARFADENLAAHATGVLVQSPDVRVAFEAPGVTAYELRPRGAPPVAGDLVRVDPGTFRLSASQSGDRLAFIVDGDPNTRWLTGRPQAGDEWVRLEFDQPRDIARVDLTVNPRSVGDYPRELEIVGQSGEGEDVLFHGAVLEQLGRGWVASPELPVVSIALPANRSATLLVRQRGRSRRWFWSVDELTVWARR